MINITERAKRELRKLLVENVDYTGARLRLLDRGEGVLGIGIDIEMPGDYIVKYRDERVLVVEPGLADNLDNIILDVAETPDGAELVIDYA
jgi:hypothetical protein